MAKWCPRCQAEYVEGWGTCSSCGEELVDEPPRRRRRGRKQAADFDPDDAIFIEPRAARDHDDPFTPVWEGPTTEASQRARRIEQAHIPVDLGEAEEPGRSRIEVPRSYIVEAIDLLEEGAGMLPLEAPEGLDMDMASDLPEAYETTGWSTGTRVAIGIVALVLAAMLVIAYI